jgi:hypothetical protein
VRYRDYKRLYSGRRNTHTCTYVYTYIYYYYIPFYIKNSNIYIYIYINVVVGLKNRDRTRIPLVRGEEFSWGRSMLIPGLAAVAPLRSGGQMAKKKIEIGG